MSYATLFLWPADFRSGIAVRPFARIIAGAMSLMLIAFVLMLGDFYLTAKTRKLTQARRESDLEAIARREIERVQHSRSEQTGEKP